MKKRRRSKRRMLFAVLIAALVLILLVILLNWVVMPLVVRRGREATVPNLVGQPLRRRGLDHQSRTGPGEVRTMSTRPCPSTGS